MREHNSARFRTKLSIIRVTIVILQTSLLKREGPGSGFCSHSRSKHPQLASHCLFGINFRMETSTGHDMLEEVLSTSATQPAALAESCITTPTPFSPLERISDPAPRRTVGVQSRRHFSPWDSIKRRVPEHLEVRWFERIPEERRAKSWNRRRAHAPNDPLVPPEWDLNVL
jgi:hypothetical protein